MTVRPRHFALPAVILILAAGAVRGQLLAPPRLPALPAAGPLLDAAGNDVAALRRRAEVLAGDRLGRLRGLVRASGHALEMTEDGPAVRGEVIAIDPDLAALAAAREAGLSVIGDDALGELRLRAVTFSAPPGVALDRLLRRLRKASPQGRFTANHVYFPSGPASNQAGAGLAGLGGGAGGVGIVDGGVAGRPALTGPVEQRGFALGAPLANAHATALASLIAGSGVVRGAAPGAPLLVADVYGADKAGGNALALARALGWMIARRAPVVAIALVGPPNPLLERAVRAALARGLTLVAAVGNDGPAAPPAYPASYPGVIAVTAVDGRDRLLVEAGNSLHVDFAAPGADMVAATLSGRAAPVRGTSYAVPFVAALCWRAARAGAGDPAEALAREAVPLGKPGSGRRYGHGLVCGACRTMAAK